MDYFLGKILHGLLLGLLLGLLHGLLHMGYYMLGFYMVEVPAADVRRRTGRDAWMGLAGSHAGLLSSVLLAPGGRFHPTGHDMSFQRWATPWASSLDHCADMNGAPLIRTPPRRSWGRGPSPPGRRRIQARRLTCVFYWYCELCSADGSSPWSWGRFHHRQYTVALVLVRGPTSRYCCAVEVV